MTKIELITWATVGPLVVGAFWKLSDQLTSPNEAESIVAMVISTEMSSDAILNKMTINTDRGSFKLYGHLSVDRGDHIVINYNKKSATSVCAKANENVCLKTI